MTYSPGLALVTGALELMACVFVLRGPGRKAVLGPAAVILFLLASYQFAEVAVCSRPEALAYARLAYLIITWLPPFGLRLLVELDGRRSRPLRAAALGYFAAAAGMCAWLLAVPGLITATVCDLVTARYFQPTLFAVAYGVFYQTGLLWLVFGSWRAMTAAREPRSRSQIGSLLAGVLGFMVPSLVIRVLMPGPGDIVPSVMCHFAVILAAGLVAMIVRERRSAGQAIPA